VLTRATIKYIAEKLTNERGNITLYALVIIPFVTTLSMLAVDVSAWNALRDQAQRDVDRIAFQAAQVLPNEDAAISFINQSVDQMGIYSLAAADVSPFGVQIEIESSYTPSFAYFLNFFTGSEETKTFSVARQSVVQVVPTDYVVIMADGRTLRPALAEAPWGNEISWPASNYWDCTLQNPPPHPDGAGARWATQSCFNPILTPLKFATISLTDSLAASRIDRVGLVFSPGRSGGIGAVIARNVRGESEIEGETYFEGHIGGFAYDDDQTVEANWFINHELGPDEDYQLGNDVCVLQEFFDNGRYTLPETLGYFGFHYGQSDCQEPLESPQCDDPDPDPYTRLSQCYLDNTLKLRQMIYWNMAQLDVDPSIVTALQVGIADLVANVQPVLDSIEQPRRRNLAYNSLRKIFLLTDYLPGTGEPGFSTVIETLQAQNIELVVGVFRHPNEPATLGERIADFQSLEAQLKADDPGRQTLRVFVASNPDDLNTSLIPKLIALGRKVALRM